MNNKIIETNEMRDVPEIGEIKPPKQYIQFLSPTELKGYQPPQDMILVGDNHITRGAVFVIGGCPGVGKSRASVALAIAGATGKDWFGLTTHRRFKTLIIQNENGRTRLAKEFSELNCDDLDQYIRISPPPPFGFAFDQPDFCEQLKKAIEEFKPDLILIDPWNAAARDQTLSDYLETFDRIRSVIPAGDNGPAFGIVAHTRKPKSDERTTGRGLSNLISGSYVLTSIPRSVFVIQHASDQTEENRIVFTCCKNNDGELGPRSCWERCNGLFASVEDFNWDEFESPGEKRRTITEEDLNTMFDSGKIKMTRKQAMEKLMKQTGCAQAAAYNALSPKGRAAARLQQDQNNLLMWKS